MSILCWELLHPFAQHYQHHLISVEPTTRDNVGSCCVHLQGALGDKRKLRVNFVTLVRLHPSYVPPNNSVDRQPFLMSKCFPSTYVNIRRLKNCVRLEYYEKSLQLVLLLPVAPPAPPSPQEEPEPIETAGSSVNLMIWPAAQDNGPIR